MYQKSKILRKFAPFWLKFRKILKSRPIKVPNLRQPDLHQLYGNYFHYYHYTVTHKWRPSGVTEGGIQLFESGDIRRIAPK